MHLETQTLPPISNQPADLEAERADGGRSSGVLVHTELGVPIYFHPSSRDFSAKLAGSSLGRGSKSELRSADFSAVLARIRLRCLVVPVEGYQIATNYSAEDDTELVVVTPCTVIEYHERRTSPYVVSVVEQERGRYGQPVTTQPRYVRRVRTLMEVLLPQPAEVERLRRICRAIRDEDQRHRDEERRLRDEMRTAYGAIKTLSAADVRYVQQHEQQVAADSAAIGATIYDLTPDDAGDDEEEEA